MDPRHLTVAEIQAHLARLRRLPERVLHLLAADDRQAVRRLAARYERARAADRLERRRVARLYREERGRRRAGQIVAGVDEVGRGSLAGPVVAAAVILPEQPAIIGLDDSKRLAPEARERLAMAIRTRAVGVAIGTASVEEIDRLNILRASWLAMRRAVEALIPPPDFILVDGRDRLPLGLAQAAVVDGDASHACIAAASIVAKVIRDRLMQDLDRAIPGYGFARHKGYGTAEHLAALACHGPCPAHRSAFLPVSQTTLFPLL
ncbi:MAG TPA: ribonuclease HII [bacterium]|nr:ribonuclease HII [bacterium]